MAKSRPTVPSLQRERDLLARGYGSIVGVDEAGRGALAGPVVAAAVILPPDFALDGVADSKTISEEKRETLHDRLVERIAAVGIGVADNQLVDEINVLQATFRAMLEAVRKCGSVDYVLVDGRDRIDMEIEQEAVVGGDGHVMSIAAASIIAKVTRDRMMREWERDFPAYRFASNKGYGTREHRKAILKHGPSPLHRRTFLGKLSQQQLSL